MKHLGVCKIILASALATTLCACGGGGGGDGGGSSSGGGATTAPVTYSANVTALVLEDTRSGEGIVVDGLPLAGATVTRN